MILLGDCKEVLQTIDSESVQCCVTSPPYWGLRDYGVDGQLGLEPTPEEYVRNLVEVFREVKRVLKNNGTLWLNLGDSYWANRSHNGMPYKNDHEYLNGAYSRRAGGRSHVFIKPKDLVGIPWMVAFALRADGWYLRSDIIWNKPNCMPESVIDRPTKAHEYIFLLSKSEKYYYDHETIKEIAVHGDPNPPRGSKGVLGRENEGRRKQDMVGERQYTGFNERYEPVEYRNKRSVWTVSTKPFNEAHFATFPPELIEPCILAGSRVGDTILDPFNGAGTTGLVAYEYGREYIGIELNPEYIEITKKRLEHVQPVINF